MPAVVEAEEAALASGLGSGEADFRAPHGNTGGNGDASLLGVVDSTIEMIDHTVVLDNVRLVGKHLVVGLRGDDEVGTLPTLPVDEVVADSKGVEGIVLATGVVGLEVEHHIER